MRNEKLRSPSNTIARRDVRALVARYQNSASSLLLSSLELSDTTIYETYIRALLGTTPHFC